MATKDELLAQFQTITSKSIEEQGKFFLRAFVMEFQGKFEEVLDIGQEFKKFAPAEGEVRELDEFAAHRFLEKRFVCHACTRGAMYTNVQHKEERLLLSRFSVMLFVRSVLFWQRSMGFNSVSIGEIDLDFNQKVAFIEYLLWKYKKTLKELFYPPNTASPEALAALEKAIEAYSKVLAERKAREDKMAELERVAAEGGVKGLRYAAFCADLTGGPTSLPYLPLPCLVPRTSLSR
jgi:hypothetical protein